MPVLTADVASLLGESWNNVRRSALERAKSAPFPTPEEEVWRYSRISELSIEEFSPAACPSTVAAENIPAGVTITKVARGEALPDGVRTDLFDSSNHDRASLFDDLNLALMDVVIVSTKAHTVFEQAIIVTHDLSEQGAAYFPRLVIDAGENSEVTVVERFVSPDGCRLLVVPALDVRTAKAARVKYLGINELGDASWEIASQQSSGDRDSDTLLATVALGGDYARVSTSARLVGQAGNTRQIAIYFTGGEQMHDFRTCQEHAAPKTTSDLLFKGAIQDQAKSVYTGLIKIHKEAKGSSAFQTNRNLTLSKGAWAESVPNLDIETNDVKCSHASTVGPIDEDQLFYLESRGIHPDVAERLVVLGFFDEVLDQLPVGGLAVGLRKKVADKLSIGAES
ncbi:MAG: Fe-S cluster assembly protein SufD [Actinomycetota bacterium]